MGDHFKSKSYQSRIRFWKNTLLDRDHKQGEGKCPPAISDHRVLAFQGVKAIIQCRDCKGHDRSRTIPDMRAMTDAVHPMLIATARVALDTKDGPRVARGSVADVSLISVAGEVKGGACQKV